MDETYFPIDIQTIVSDAVKSFDIYYKNDEKMDLYYSGGEIISEASKYINEHKSEELFIRNLDRKYYYLYLEEVLDTIIQDSKISSSVKAKTIYKTLMEIAKPLFTSPNEEMIQRYRQVIYIAVNFILHDKDALQNLINLTTFDFTLSNHSINVGILSTGLAVQLFRDDTDHDLDEIVAGFFLHDIGKTELSVDILNKKESLSNADWKLIKRHPEEGVRILDKLDSLSPSVKMIVLQHHERHDGSGYPFKLKKEQIHVYGRICSIADCFDALTSYRPFKQNHTSFDALIIMKKEMFKHFDPEYFEKFLKLLSA